MVGGACAPVVDPVSVASLFLLMTMLAHSAPAAAKPEPQPGIRGVATYYDWHRGQAAAGPALRRLLGPRWRGMTVTVRSSGRQVTVKLTDWCACAPRHGRPTLIDLDRRSFAILAPPSRGVIEVGVSR